MKKGQWQVWPTLLSLVGQRLLSLLWCWWTSLAIWETFRRSWEIIHDIISQFIRTCTLSTLSLSYSACLCWIITKASKQVSMDHIGICRPSFCVFLVQEWHQTFLEFWHLLQHFWILQNDRINLWVKPAFAGTAVSWSIRRCCECMACSLYDLSCCQGWPYILCRWPQLQTKPDEYFIFSGVCVSQRH